MSALPQAQLAPSLIACISPPLLASGEMMGGAEMGRLLRAVQECLQCVSQEIGL